MTPYKPREPTWVVYCVRYLVTQFSQFDTAAQISATDYVRQKHDVTSSEYIYRMMKYYIAYGYYNKTERVTRYLAFYLQQQQ